MSLLVRVFFIGVCGLSVVWAQSAIQYLMAGENVGCSDYAGFEEITDITECSAAGVALSLEDQVASTFTSSIYPRGCWALRESGDTLYYNPDPDTSAPTTGQSIRFPICKSSSAIVPQSICFSQGNGFDPVGGSTTPNINAAGLLSCSSSFSFTPYDRQGYMYLNFNPKEVFYILHRIYHKQLIYNCKADINTILSARIILTE